MISLGTVCLVVGLALAMVSTSAAANAVEPTDVKPAVWDGVSNLTTVENLWFSGQPDGAALEQARDSGVKIVINLREESEHDWDEATAARALGMEYHNIPVAGPEPFSAEVFGRIDEVVVKHPGQGILIHCASSNRVGGWFATHLVQKRGMSVEDALSVGRAAGITADAVDEKVRAYLGSSPGVTK